MALGMGGTAPYPLRVLRGRYQKGRSGKKRFCRYKANYNGLPATTAFAMRVFKPLHVSDNEFAESSQEVCCDVRMKTM
jgi:hypothetical protein